MTEHCRVCGREIPEGPLSAADLRRFHERCHWRQAITELFNAAKETCANNLMVVRLGEAVAEVERIERLLMPDLHRDLDKRGESG